LPTLKELAGQELAQRYSRANSTRVAPRAQTMRAADPSIRSYLSEFMRDTVDATGLGGGYRQGLLNAAGGIETAVDFSPVVGDVLALEDAGRSYRQGDMLGTGINLLGAIPIVGDAASKAAKAARALGGSNGVPNVGLVREGVGKSRDRVGTTGQYIGGPAGVDTPEKLQAMQDRYIQDVELGQAGADWYRDASNFINQASLPGNRQGVADTIGITSQGTNVDSNLGFAIKGINQRAAGLPVNTGRFPGNQSRLIEEALSGERSRLGPKRQPFADNLSVGWNPDQANTSVNDIWQGRAFGYTHPDGKPWDAGFSPQQHAFMDENMLVIEDRLNNMQMAGRTDWDNLNTQAASWSGAKIRAGDITESDAAKQYGDFADKYAVNATYEQAPGANTGQLEGILSRPFAERQAFEDAATWTNAQGIDDLYSSGGMLAQPTNQMVGAYTPSSTGVLEINPGKSARPLVQQSAGEIIPSEARLLDIGESSRAYIDVQNAGAYHKVIPDSQTKAGERTSVNIELDGSPDPETMSRASQIAEQNGFFAVDTGNGVNFVNDIYSDVGGARTGTSLGKELKGQLGQEIESLLGKRVNRVKVQAGYEDYESAWRSGQGSGAATEQFLNKLDENPTFAANIEPALKRKAAANIARDEAAGFPQREDVRNARQILIDKGIEGLRSALKSGAVLPAIVAAVLAPSVLKDSEEPQAVSSLRGI